DERVKGATARSLRDPPRRLDEPHAGASLDREHASPAKSAREAGSKRRDAIDVEGSIRDVLAEGAGMEREIGVRLGDPKKRLEPGEPRLGAGRRRPVENRPEVLVMKRPED